MGILKNDAMGLVRPNARRSSSWEPCCGRDCEKRANCCLSNSNVECMLYSMGCNRLRIQVQESTPKGSTV
jgi:hypothetical protein